jgi:hypothetical protein
MKSLDVEPLNTVRIALLWELIFIITYIFKYQAAAAYLPLSATC